MNFDPPSERDMVAEQSAAVERRIAEQQKKQGCRMARQSWKTYTAAHAAGWADAVVFLMNCGLELDPDDSSFPSAPQEGASSHV